MNPVMRPPSTGEVTFTASVHQPRLIGVLGLSTISSLHEPGSVRGSLVITASLR